MVELSRVEIEEKFTSLQRSINSPHVFLETRKVDANNKHSFYFTNPKDIITLYKQDDPSEFFKKLELAQSEGYWLAGYFCYEAGYFFEPYLNKYRDNLKINRPLAWFGVFQPPLMIDQTRVDLEPTLKEHPFLRTRTNPCEINNLKINMNPDEYHNAISKIKSYLKEGDTYQVNFTLKYKFLSKENPFDLFRFLQSKQNIAYSAFVNNGHQYFLSLSPELFFKKEGARMTSKPMKGTAKRGRFNLEDVEYAQWLTNDPKNLAENTMIVDLIRNDLGKKSLIGSVYVSDPYQVEKFSTLHQMTSTINSTLQPGTTIEDLFLAMFPFGSITGAPKIRTMEIINELEKEPRGIYTGAIGYFSPDGNAQFNVAIRTPAIDKYGNGEMGIGGGIVAESLAKDEFEECLLKGHFLTKRINSFSLIETMRMENGEIYLLDLHMERLIDSSKYFDLICPLKHIKTDLKMLNRKRETGLFKIRLVLDQQGNYKIQINPIKGSPKKPVLLLKISEKRMNSADLWLYHKTTNRTLYDTELNLAIKQGYDEVLFINERGEISEGSISNIFIQQSGQLVTPHQKAGLLKGTLRQSLLDNKECYETILKEQDILNAEKIFIGNSVMGLVEAELVTSDSKFTTNT